MILEQVHLEDIVRTILWNDIVLQAANARRAIIAFRALEWGHWRPGCGLYWRGILRRPIYFSGLDSARGLVSGPSGAAEYGGGPEDHSEAIGCEGDLNVC